MATRTTRGARGLARLALALAALACTSSCQASSGSEGLLSKPAARLSEKTKQKGLGGTNGDIDYCDNPAQPCLTTLNEGDCDDDSQCTGGVDPVCGTDNGARFGAPRNFDFCWERHCEDRVLSGDETDVDCGGSCGPCGICPGQSGERGFCTPSCRCQAGQGDCDADDECASGLVCGTENGARFGADPTLDFCWPATCANGQVDPGELGVDCGGPCGLCPADAGAPDGG